MSLKFSHFSLIYIKNTFLYCTLNFKMWKTTTTKKKTIENNLFPFHTKLLAPRILVSSRLAWALNSGSLKCSHWFWRCHGSPPEKVHKAQHFSEVQKILHSKLSLKSCENYIVPYWRYGDHYIWQVFQQRVAPRRLQTPALVSEEE